MVSAEQPDSPQADDVEPGHAVIPLLEHERRDILGGAGHAAEHRQPADPHPLLHGGVAREDAAVLEA